MNGRRKEQPCCTYSGKYSGTLVLASRRGPNTKEAGRPVSPPTLIYYIIMDWMRRSNGGDKIPFTLEWTMKKVLVFPLIQACHEDPIGKRRKWFNVTPTSFSFANYVFHTTILCKIKWRWHYPLGFYAKWKLYRELKRNSTHMPPIWVYSNVSHSRCCTIINLKHEKWDNKK